MASRTAMRSGLSLILEFDYHQEHSYETVFSFYLSVHSPDSIRL